MNAVSTKPTDSTKYLHSTEFSEVIEWAKDSKTAVGGEKLHEASGKTYKIIQKQSKGSDSSSLGAKVLKRSLGSLAYAITSIAACVIAVVSHFLPVPTKSDVEWLFHKNSQFGDFLFDRNVTIIKETTAGSTDSVVGKTEKVRYIRLDINEVTP